MDEIYRLIFEVVAAQADLVAVLDVVNVENGFSAMLTPWTKTDFSPVASTLVASIKEHRVGTNGRLNSSHCTVAVRPKPAAY